MHTWRWHEKFLSGPYPEFRKYITIKDLSYDRIYKLTGIKVSTFWHKINGKRPFTLEEIWNIAENLCLTKKQVYNFFFKDYVDLEDE